MSQRPAKSSPDPAIAIIGIGCLFPGSQDRQGYWAGIRDGRDMIEEIPDGYWNPDDYHDGDQSSADRTYGRRGGFLTPIPFNPIDFGIAPRDLEATDTSQLLSLVAARQALVDAGYDPRTTFDRSRTSVILGVTGALEMVVPLGARLGHPHWWRALRESGVDEETAAEVVSKISSSYVSWQENSFPGLLGNVVAGRIANRLDLHGTNCVTDAACASSLAALHLASLELHSGRSDMVVTGGVDTFNDIFMYMCFSKTPALSPTGDARPFDGQGDGTILGEGIGIVVLKRLDDAVRDGDRIYARLLSIGTSSDGKGSAIYAPTVDGQQRALQDAYQQASISPSTVGLVEAHGTGTAVGDAIELRALQEIYAREGSDSHRCALGSVKSQIGHTKAAAGAAGLIKAVLALHHKVQPPSIKIRQPLDSLRETGSPFHIEEVARPWVQHPDFPRRAAVSSFGFGGSNFHAVLEENSAGRIETDWNDCALLFSFSASQRNSLLQQLENALTEIQQLQNSIEIGAVARDSRARFRASDDHRISIVVGRSDDAAARLKSALEAVQQEQDTRWSLPAGIDRDHGPRRGSLAVIFPGQGSQRVDMLRSTACRFPEMIRVIDDAERAFWNQQEDSGLAAKIWPPREWDDHSSAHDEALRQTDVAQPALGAVSLGLYQILGRFGIEGELFGGHSFGELTALAAAGRLGEVDFHQLANFRGRLMASAGGDDAGSMLAVALPIAELERFVEQNCPHLVIANRNAPQQAVLSGSSPAISDAMRVLDQRGIRHRKLPVAAAFHSPEVASAAIPFEEVLNQARIHPSTAPVFSNSTGRRYPDGEGEARSLLANQITRPVQFLEMIEEMVQCGASTFLEVGPGQVLTGLIQSILEDVSPQSSAICIDAQKVDGTDLARAIGRLAVEGHPVDLCTWDPCGPTQVDADGAMVVMIGGANLKPGEVTPTVSSVAVTPPKTRTESVTRTPDAVILPTSIESPVTDALQASSQESLMQAIEAALAMQRTLAEAQRAAEQVLEASLSGTPKSIAPQSIAPPLSAPPSSVPIVEDVEVIVPVAEEDGLTDLIIEVVAEKTGYPSEAIAADLDLEGDLGIDSIKRVEILSALREQRPELPAIPPELLGSLRSIDAIVDWYGKDPSATTKILAASSETSMVTDDGSNVGEPHTPPLSPSPPANDAPPKVQILEATAVALPVPRIARATKQHSFAGRSWLVACDSPALGTTLVARLKQSGISALHASLGSIEGGLPTTPGTPLGGLLVVVDSPTDPDQAMAHSFQWLREAGKVLLDQDGSLTPLVAMVQRFDGHFGLGTIDPISCAIDPACAALSGLAKCAAREWTSMDVRSIDLSPDFHDTRQAVDELVIELLEGQGMEVGLTPERRIEIGLESLPATTPSRTLISKGALVVVTGGARGVTGACVDELARRYQPSLLLLGRTPAPGSEPDWAAAVADDQLESHLFRNSPEGVTPALIREQALEIHKVRELARHLDELRSLGCEVEYRSLDVRNRKELTRCIDEARASHGPVRGIIHGAGVLADRWICDKSDQQFDLVWTTKVDPARHLLSICKDDDLDFISFFSSTTARLGRKGQSDYAAANEVLNRMATIESVRRPNCQVASLGWGPWDGGMVHEGLRSVFHEEGIELIPLAQGARLFIEKMESMGPAQPILLAPLGSIAETMQQITDFGNTPSNTIDDTESTDTSNAITASGGNTRMQAGPTLTLSIDRFPAMKDHVLNGRAVIPAAFLLEWCAQAALHRHPGLELQGVDQFKILKGVILDPREEQQITWMTGTPESAADHLRVPVEIRSSTADLRLHARAQILLGPRSTTRSDLMAPEYSGADDPGYGTSLFHGPRFQCIQKVSKITRSQLAIRSNGTSKPSTWFDAAPRSDWLIDPLHIDAAFQALILWSRSQHQKPCLPCGIARLRCHSPIDSGLLETRIHIESVVGSMATARIEVLNRTGSPAITIEGAEVVIDASLESAFQRDRLTEEAHP